MQLDELTRAAHGVIDPRRVRIGITDLAPLPDVREELNRRDRTGERGSLGFVYRDPEVASRPADSFPWGRSIVVAAVGYLREGDGRGANETERSVARFADGDRYEDLRLVLGRLADRLREAGHRTEAVFDDDRLVDRALAVRSGVAWWGKSTMAITPGLGPWFLIGSVVTDAELEATQAMDRTCGTCTACIPACPTGAIIAPGMLDARRCLAAVFQTRGAIPGELRDAAGGRIYGCDDCLVACPPGHRYLDSVEPARQISPRSVLCSTDDEILREWSHWYIPGRHVRFVRRNALVALGNSGSADDVALVAGYVGHPDPMLAEHAAWALGAIGGREAIEVFSSALGAELHPRVRESIEASLRRSVPTIEVS